MRPLYVHVWACLPSSPALLMVLQNGRRDQSAPNVNGIARCRSPEPRSGRAQWVTLFNRIHPASTVASAVGLIPQSNPLCSLQGQHSFGVSSIHRTRRGRSQFRTLGDVGDVTVTLLAVVIASMLFAPERTDRARQDDTRCQ